MAASGLRQCPMCRAPDAVAVSAVVVVDAAVVDAVATSAVVADAVAPASSSVVPCARCNSDSEVCSRGHALCARCADTLRCIPVALGGIPLPSGCVNCILGIQDGGGASDFVSIYAARFGRSESERAEADERMYAEERHRVQMSNELIKRAREYAWAAEERALVVETQLRMLQQRQLATAAEEQQRASAAEERAWAAEERAWAAEERALAAEEQQQMLRTERMRSKVLAASGRRLLARL